MNVSEQRYLSLSFGNRQIVYNTFIDAKTVALQRESMRVPVIVQEVLYGSAHAHFDSVNCRC